MQLTSHSVVGLIAWPHQIHVPLDVQKSSVSTEAGAAVVTLLLCSVVAETVMGHIMLMIFTGSWVVVVKTLIWQQHHSAWNFGVFLFNSVHKYLVNIDGDDGVLVYHCGTCTCSSTCSSTLHSKIHTQIRERLSDHSTPNTRLAGWDTECEPYALCRLMEG